MMKDKNISLTVGQELQIEVYLNDKINRFSTLIIGYLEKQSVIILTPTINGRCLILREGLQVTGRLLSGNRVYGFSAKISAVALKPYPHLHLKFPKEFESLQIREAERVGIVIPAEVTHVNNKELDNIGLIDVMDVSTGGALIRSIEMLAEVSATLLIKFTVDIGDGDKVLTVPAIIRNERKQIDKDSGETCYFYGLQFDLKSTRDKLMVQGFIYEKILQSRN